MNISLKSWRIRLIVALFLVLAFYIGFYVWILQSVKHTVTSIYMDGKNGIALDDSSVSDAVKSKFLQFVDFPNQKPDDNVQVQLSTGHVFHTFTRGTVWIRYTYEGVGRHDHAARYGVSRVPIKIKAKLDHGSWVIVDKEEQP
ncbi:MULTISPECIES: hypothetical protein [unclassified Paenibacillus]|uniref:hypothetical protein n=1 Tax=unclassified Paenibacillus TaxID=185978 RepID=UPI0010431F9F|nr:MULTISPECIES: hypothetical protein [unclassified Paenibacillus]NIK68198.1 hypothetical protein [Paenibacillus sp. BK720]TCM99585.1 hypothetical protein EV294_102890 [Paenibacillus sp. BK033]